MRRVLLVFGTRPEAIKLGPVVKRLMLDRARFETCVCVTAQHRELLDQVLDRFDIEPDHDLGAMRDGQSLTQTTGRILCALEAVIEAEQPDVIVVQGDTTSTVCGAMAGFYNQVPVVHIEAGLRTGDKGDPFPEEMNRRVASEIAAFHFSSTAAAAANLSKENVSGKVVVSGNPGIDALLQTATALDRGLVRSTIGNTLTADKRTILVTAHRRENFGAPLVAICDAIDGLARRADVRIVFPVHPNPQVRRVVEQRLSEVPNVVLLDPLDYVDFVDLMRRSYLVLTDSGGIQEEAPSLGKPVLVMRDTTERPEALEAGAARLVGTDSARIVLAATELLDDRDVYLRMARRRDIFGDGRAAERIVDALAGQLAASASVAGRSTEVRRDRPAA